MLTLLTRPNSIPTFRFLLIEDMAAVLSSPHLFPETVPGGSLIGSMTSNFAATFTLLQSGAHRTDPHSKTPTSTSLESDFQQQIMPTSDTPTDSELASAINNLSRSKMETLVTQIWFRNLPNQKEGKLRDLIAGAVEKGLLKEIEIYNACDNCFTSLPTDLQIRILSYLPIRTRINFLTAVNKQLTPLAHYPQLWKHLDLQMPFQPNFIPLSTFLTKYTPAQSVESIYFPSSSSSNEFLKLLVTLKRLRTKLVHVHLEGKQITTANISALESLLGKWTQTLIIDSPHQKVDMEHIAALIGASSRLKTFCIKTSNKFSLGEYNNFMGHLVRAGATMRLHHLHPEINARLKSLQVGCVTVHTVKFSMLADLGKYFPRLELLRIENWKIVVDETAQKITPIHTLRGLSFLGINITGAKRRKDNVSAKVLSDYIGVFSSSLRVLVLGIRETELLRWSFFTYKPSLGCVFRGKKFPSLRTLWLRACVIDCHDFLSLKGDNLRYIVLEGCKGLNGGWIKAFKAKWKGVVVYETDGRVCGMKEVILSGRGV